MSSDDGVKAKINAFRNLIIEWYERFGDKDIAWRNTDDPWRVLVATLLLRKTTTTQVLKIYPKFIEKYPRASSILRSSKEEIKDVIKPLGLENQRAELITRIAQVIVSKFKGKVPCSLDDLKKIPGVGNYTVSEILLVACRKPAPLLDRNMIRIIERVFGVKSVKRRPHTDPKMWAFAKVLVPRDPEEAKAFNYGVLDFARKVCTARNPRCSDCPIKDMCNYYARIRGLNIS